MKTTALTSLALLLTTTSSFAASGKNLVVCGWNDNDDAITIRQDVGGQIVALFSMLDHGTEAFEVKLMPVPAGVYGAGMTYEGHGLSLHLNTDVPQIKGFTPATLTMPSMEINGEAFDCTLVN